MIAAAAGSGGFLDRERASRLMAGQGLDALLLAQPETIRYAAGSFAGVASFWRRAGAAFVLVPGDASMPMSAVVGDLQAGDFRTQSGLADVRTHPLWVETGFHAASEEDVAASLRVGHRARGGPSGHRGRRPSIRGAPFGTSGTCWPNAGCWAAGSASNSPSSQRPTCRCSRTSCPNPG